MSCSHPINLPAHKVHGVRQAIEAAGTSLRYPSPYVPTSIPSKWPSLSSRPCCAAAPRTIPDLFSRRSAKGPKEPRSTVLSVEEEAVRSPGASSGPAAPQTANRSMFSWTRKSDRRAQLVDLWATRDVESRAGHALDRRGACADDRYALVCELIQERAVRPVARILVVPAARPCGRI